MAKVELTTKSLKKYSNEYDGVTKNGKNFTKKLSYTDIENNWATYQNKTSVLRNILGLLSIKGIDFQYGKANTQKKGDLIKIMDKKENSHLRKLIQDTYEDITLKPFSNFMESGYVATKIKNTKKKTVKKNSKKSTNIDVAKELAKLPKSELVKALLELK